MKPKISLGPVANPPKPAAETEVTPEVKGHGEATSELEELRARVLHIDRVAAGFEAIERGEQKRRLGKE